MAKKWIMVVLTLTLLFCTIGLANGEVWVGGQVGGAFTTDKDYNLKTPFVKGTLNDISTDSGLAAGFLVGYNFCMPCRPAWEKYFGVALDFTYNQFNQPSQFVSGSLRPRFFTGAILPKIHGSQFGLTLFGRAQYPLGGNEQFTNGRIVPFLMFGPGVVWQSSANFALVTEIGVDFFIIPQLSVGPALRYRHVFGGPDYEVRTGRNFVNLNGSGQDQFMAMARVAYHF